ncbi:MAG: glycerophosphodiester phosphodiesterase family protein [Xanthomonadales bacterium]|nr:glycerophosphodiester phosphodiesterase family protein [Xanthomonadales bacterium]
MTPFPTLSGSPPAIIAHRGASGLLPEHTLPAYRLAIEQGAEVIEPDLVPSADGVLFARHDAHLSRSTDVADRPEFADRREPGLEDRLDWWVDRFTAEELGRLRAIQPFPGRDRSHDGLYPVPRLSEVLALARAHGRILYPELKHPSWFRRRGRDPAALLAAELEEAGLRGPQAPVWLQCFETEPLRELRERLGLRVFALVAWEEGRGWPELLAEAGRLHAWASGLGLDKRFLRDPGAGEGIRRLHGMGLEVHAWTFRDDLVPAGEASAEAELGRAMRLGVDALFCDFPATALTLRARLLSA